MLVYFGRIAEEEGGVEVRDREAGGGERDASSSCRLQAETPGCSAKTQLINEGAGSPVPAAINTPNIWSKRKPLGGQTQSAELALPSLCADSHALPSAGLRARISLQPHSQHLRRLTPAHGVLHPQPQFQERGQATGSQRTSGLQGPSPNTDQIFVVSKS